VGEQKLTSPWTQNRSLCRGVITRCKLHWQEQ